MVASEKPLGKPPIVAIFHPEGNADQNPALWEAISSLRRQMHRVILLSASKASTDYTSEVVFRVNRRGFRRRLFWLLLQRQSNPLLQKLLFNWILSADWPSSSTFVIGVDREGIIEAEAFAQKRGCPVFYFSFEIMFTRETSVRFKKPEIQACRSIVGALVQDEARAHELASENNIPLDKMIKLPVAPKGLGQAIEPRVRDELGIPLDRKVALLMGSVAEWSGFTEILKTVPLWPKDWVLLVHSRDGIDAIDGVGLIEEVERGRIFVTTRAFSHFGDLGGLLNGIDVGLVFYLPNCRSPFTGRNIEVIGLSSGKSSLLLSYGIPLISNAKYGYDELISQYQCGIHVDTPSEIPAALDLHDFSTMKEQALKLFSERLDYALYEKQLLEFLLK